jgi:hypothetical protein
VWRGLLFVVGFAGGWWVVNQLFFDGFPFPDQVAGQPRVESREAEEATEALSALGGLLDVEMEFAFYGPEVQPAYVMFAFELPERLLPLDVQPTSRGSIPFQCRTDVQGSGCIWEVEGMIVGLGGSGTPEELEPVARRVRAELQS